MRTAWLAFGLLFALSSHELVQAENYGVLLFDRSGSMTQPRFTGNSRFTDAVRAARLDILRDRHSLDQVTILYFSGEGIIEHLPFTALETGKQDVLAAIESLPPPVIGPPTPLAQAICMGVDLLTGIEGNGYLLGYTDGGENFSDSTGDNLCNPCDELTKGQWYLNCDPADDLPACSEWQRCFIEHIIGDIGLTWRYFNNPADVKSETGDATMSPSLYLESGAGSDDKAAQSAGDDYRLLRYLSEQTEGQFDVLPNEYRYASDADLDRVEDLLDNCPLVYNPAQTDGDGNGYGDACCACHIHGDLDLDNHITMLDITLLIDIIHGLLPDTREPSCPTSAGDINCDGFVTLLDFNYLVDYVFGGGAQPCEPCVTCPSGCP